VCHAALRWSLSKKSDPPLHSGAFPLPIIDQSEGHDKRNMYRLTANAEPVVVCCERRPEQLQKEDAFTRLNKVAEMVMKLSMFKGREVRKMFLVDVDGKRQEQEFKGKITRVRKDSTHTFHVRHPSADSTLVAVSTTHAAPPCAYRLGFALRRCSGEP
jgi:hypothetical protein